MYQSVKSQMQAIWFNRFVLSNLLFNRITKRYLGSILGIAWSLINPVLMMFSLALIFPIIMRFKMENYILYLFSGIVGWGFLSSSINNGSLSIIMSESLIKQVYLPKIIFPLVVVLSEFVNFIFTATALHIVGFAFGMPLHTHLLYFLCASLVTLVFCFSLTSLISAATVYFRDIKHILGIVMQASFFMTPIIYPITRFPEKYWFVFEFNPFYQFIRLFQVSIYETGPPQWNFFWVPLAASIVMLFFTFIYYHKYSDYLIYRL